MRGALFPLFKNKYTCIYRVNIYYYNYIGKIVIHNFSKY